MCDDINKEEIELRVDSTESNYTNQSVNFGKGLIGTIDLFDYKC